MPDNQKGGEQENKKRVAVVAVHGVADQKPHETAQTIAGMLLGYRDNGQRIYSDFKELELRLPVEPVLESTEPLPKPNYFTFDPRNELFKDLHQPGKGDRPVAQKIIGALQAGRSIVAAEERTTPDTLEHQIMREQLEQYRPAEADRIYKTADSVYETTQLNGFRIDPSTSQKTCEVHVYEMYWADLSRVSSALWRVMIDFYQLLAYLCGVGRKTLYFAQAECRHSSWWSWFRRSQLFAECMLTLAIPVINLCLLALAMIVLPFQIPWQKHELAGLVASSAVVSVIAGWLFHHKHEAAPATWWPWLLLGPLMAGAAVAVAFTFWIEAGHRYGFYSVLAFCWWLLLGLLLCWAMKRYNRRRTGAFLTGITGTVLTSAVYILELYSYRNKVTQPLGNSILAAASETALWLCLVLVVVWLLFFFWTVFTSIFGLCLTSNLRAKSTKQEEPDKQALSRSIWTVNLTLIFPGALTLIVNLAIWQALYITLHRLKDHAVAFRDPLFPFPISSDANSIQQVMQWMIQSFASGWFTIFFFSFCVAALIAIWSLLPAIVGRNDVVSGATSIGQEKEELVRRSKWLGQDLSTGYRAMRVSGEILRVVLVVGFVPLAYLIYHCFATHQDFFQMFPRWLNHPWVLSSLGLTVLLMLTASQGPFRFLALGFRSTIDVALDVANWLRSNPLDANPKARITARCVSQLDYLADWRDPRDAGRYDAFIIIAHSQGTVIVSEILRFLEVEKHPVVTKLRDRRLYLFTMGCPLRQLYSWRFPHQYAWARHDAKEWAAKEPDPAHLGIAEWSNAYRSGDYVGRYLWHSDVGNDQWDLEIHGENGRREFCIGAGGHTHYWDKTAPKIVEELDRLIGDACSS